LSVEQQRGEKDTAAADPEGYRLLMDILQHRSSVRRLKPDPIPEGYVEKIVEAGRWAMSGANSQPWEFIVVRDPERKQALFQAYQEVNTEYIFWMEQQRVAELRHPSYHIQGDPHEQLRRRQSSRAGWGQAPALIVVLGDGRRQWGTVMGGHTFGRGMSHLTDGLANCCMIMHLAAASLGLGSQWCTIHIQEPYKRILKVPDLLMLYLIIPVGYPDADPRPGVRRELSEMLHQEEYDPSKYMSNEDILHFLAGLRGVTLEKYRSSWSKETPER
jgi:nitroreductase